MAGASRWMHAGRAPRADVGMTHALPGAELLVPLAAKMSEEPFRLIIMDSVTANLRVDFTGRGASYCTRLNAWICAAA